MSLAATKDDGDPMLPGYVLIAYREKKRIETTNNRHEPCFPAAKPNQRFI